MQENKSNKPGTTTNEASLDPERPLPSEEFELEPTTGPTVQRRHLGGKPPVFSEWGSEEPSFE